MDSVQQDPNPVRPLQIGWCEYKDCGVPAYYTIKFGSDDLESDLCDRHHSSLLKQLHDTVLPGLLNHDEDDE